MKKTIITLIIGIFVNLALFSWISYEVGLKEGRNQIIKEIGLATYNEVKNPIFVDTIWDKGKFHYDTTRTYIVLVGHCSNYTSTPNELDYSIGLPDSMRSGYDGLTLLQIDTVLQNKELNF